MSDDITVEGVLAAASIDSVVELDVAAVELDEVVLDYAAAVAQGRSKRL
jgi:hypothetical protein